MSHNHLNENENLEEAEDAFIDLEDPNLEIMSDHERNEEESNFGGGNEQDQEEEGDDVPQQDAEMRDLNDAPDYEPERDDASATFASPELKPLHAIAQHPTDHQIIASAGEAEEIYIIRVASDAKSFALEHTLRGHTDTVSLLSFSPDGKWLASGSLDSTVGLWSTTSWQRVYSFTDLYGEIMTLLWHPSSLVLVAGADDAQAAMWNVLKGTLAMYFVGHRGPVTCAIWTPDNKRLVLGSSDASVSICNPKTGEQEVNITKDLSPDNAGITALCFVNADQCVVGCEDGTLHVISIRTGKTVSHLEECHEQSIESLQVNESSTMFVTSSCDCKVIVWNVNDFTARTIFEVEESVIPARWVRRHLVIAGCSDGNIRMWDGRSMTQEPIATFMGHRRMIFDFVTAENHCASVSDDGTVKLFELPDASE